jgi:hypothetical protein
VCNKSGHHSKTVYKSRTPQIRDSVLKSAADAEFYLAKISLIIYNLFNYAIHSSDCVASNVKTNSD